MRTVESYQSNGDGTNQRLADVEIPDDPNTEKVAAAGKLLSDIRTGGNTTATLREVMEAFKDLGILRDV